MTLPAFGVPLTLCQISGEFGGTAPHSLSEYYGVATGIPTSGIICISQFYGKSKACIMGGGYYFGVWCGYKLILSDITAGASRRMWSCADSDRGTTIDNGYYNTYSRLNSAAYPAAYFAASLSLEGQSDWYLPSLNELSVLYSNRSLIPADQITTGSYLSSSEIGTTLAWIIDIGSGSGISIDKQTPATIRAIRRML